MPNFDETAPPQPARLTARFERVGDTLSYVCAKRDWSGCFLLVWLIGWTVGCVFLAGAVIRERSVFMLLFAIPFWAAWLLVFCLVLNAFARVEVFELDREGARFLRRVVKTLHRRTVPLAEIQGFETWTANSERGRRTRGIEMQTLGSPVRFGDRLPQAELVWMLYQLNAHLAGLQPLARRERASLPVPAAAAPVAANEPTAGEELPGDRIQAVALAARPLEPPSDSRWQRSDDFDQFVFVNRGRWGCGSVAAVLFVNAFWNGIVGVFVSLLIPGVPVDGKPEGLMWWFLLVFLIPFEVIGLAMFAGLVALLLEPFRRTAWCFGNGSVVCRMTWLGVGRTWTYPVSGFDRIDLHEGVEAATQGFRVHQQNSVAASTETGGSARLVFVESDNRELFSIKALTVGEARWMADVVLRERRFWFR